MDNFHSLKKSILGMGILFLVLLLLVACQNMRVSSAGSEEIDEELTQMADEDTQTLADAATPVPPTKTPTSAPPTETPTITPTPIIDPCKIKYFPIDGIYPNPQANLDPETNTTYMIITVDPNLLLPDFSFHWWWDTRAFKGDLSFNKGNGACEILWDTHQIKCDGLPLAGTDNIPTGAYEYDISIVLQGYDCNLYPNYQQKGSVFMDTLDHKVFMVNGEDPQ